MRMRPSSSTTRNSIPLQHGSRRRADIPEWNVTTSLSRRAFRGGAKPVVYAQHAFRAIQGGASRGCRMAPAGALAVQRPTARQRPCGVDPRRVRSTRRHSDRRASETSRRRFDDGVAGAPSFFLLLVNQPLEHKSITRDRLRPWRGARLRVPQRVPDGQR